MPKQDLAHEYLEWAKHKVDEVDAALAALSTSVEALKKEARTEIDHAAGRLQSARDAFKAKVETLRSDVAASKAIADDAYVAIEKDWTHVELAFQDFLKAATGEADVVKKALAARAEAQRKSLQTSLHSIKSAALAQLDHARSEADAVYRRLAAETEKAEAKLGKATIAGDESWKAIKSGVDEIVAVYSRTWKKISEAISEAR
jgi:hypothetical protein